jgi:hypothetical protein
MSLSNGHESRPQTDRNRRGRFTRGNAAYRSRQSRIAEKLEALRQTYDASSAGHMALLATVAVHLSDADVARSRLARTRATNSAQKLLALVPKITPRQRTVSEILGLDND